MEVNFITKDLLSKLNIIGKVVSNNKVSLFDAITIVADNVNGSWLYGRNATVAVYAKVGSKVINPGKLSVNGVYLWQTIKTYPKDATVHMSDNTVVCQNFTNTLASTSDPLFNMPQVDTLKPMPDLLKMLGLISWADRIFIDNNYMVGLDATAKQVGILTNIGLAGTNYISRDMIGVLSSFNGQCSCQMTPDNIVIRKDDFTIVGSLEDMPKVPAYELLLPTHNTPCFDVPVDFISAVQNADNTAHALPIQISFQNGQVRIIANNPDIGDTDITLPTKTAGQGKMYIYGKQLISALTRNKSKIYKGPSMIILEGTAGYIEVLSEVDEKYARN